MSADELRGQGRWAEALELVQDPLARADLLNEQALFAGDDDAREAAARELDRAEARLLLERGRILHARFLSERAEDTRELELFERALALAGDDRALAAECALWIGLFHQVVRGDHDVSLPWFERAYADGDSRLRSYAVRHLGFVHDAAGRHDEAWAAFEESVALRRADGFLPGVAAGLLTLGEVAAEHGRVEQARALLEEAREVAAGAGAQRFLARIEGALDGLP